METDVPFWPTPAEAQSMVDEERAKFLARLDKSNRVEVDDWVAQFIESNLERRHFTPKQRAVIDELILTYADDL